MYGCYVEVVFNVGSGILFCCQNHLVPELFSFFYIFLHLIFFFNVFYYSCTINGSVINCLMTLFEIKDIPVLLIAALIHCTCMCIC